MSTGGARVVTWWSGESKKGEERVWKSNGVMGSSKNKGKPPGEGSAGRTLEARTVEEAEQGGENNGSGAGGSTRGRGVLGGGETRRRVSKTKHGRGENPDRHHRGLARRSAPNEKKRQRGHHKGYSKQR